MKSENTPPFRIDKLADRESRVDRLAEAIDRFELQPSYQRQSDVWGEEKRQLFIDSLINGYDVPKLYFHRLPAEKNGRSYAIVDGKQRLEAIRGFLKGDYSLSQDFVDVLAAEEQDAAAGMSYIQLTAEHPTIAGRLLRRQLDIVVVETDDLEIIEELFSRLNEAEPLNAPEKRNALGGPIPAVVRDVVRTHEFFTDRLPFENTRYRQYDLATKFLFLADKRAFASTKKRSLDDFVLNYKAAPNQEEAQKTVKRLKKSLTAVLNRMVNVFEGEDELLSSIGLVTVYFLAFLFDPSVSKSRLTRDRLNQFDMMRRHNRALLRRQQAAVARGDAVSGQRIRQDLAIFDRLMQSPNDGQALEYRYRILRAFLEDRRFHEGLPTELKHRVGDI